MLDHFAGFVMSYLHDSRDESWVLDIFLGLLTDSRVPPQKGSLDIADTRTQQFLLLKHKP